ncbi:MAG: DUF5665 domain-containing protein, partial [Clostridiales bacterium]
MGKKKSGSPKKREVNKKTQDAVSINNKLADKQLRADNSEQILAMSGKLSAQELLEEADLQRGDKISQEELTLAMSNMEWLIAYINRMGLGRYVELLNKPKRVLYINFLAGAARGFGFAVGFSLLGFLGVYILNKLSILNLPVIG